LRIERVAGQQKDLETVHATQSPAPNYILTN
jgi:hypothetical protein